MSRIWSAIATGLKSIFDLARSTREAYDGSSRFAKLRVWILGIFVLDVIITLTFVLSFGSKAIDVDVQFQAGFPSNMLIVRNEGSQTLRNVLFVLDGRYRMSVERLDPGLRGLEVNREFRDADDFSPDDNYRPKEVLIQSGGDVMQVRVEQRPPQ